MIVQNSLLDSLEQTESLGLGLSLLPRFFTTAKLWPFIQTVLEQAPLRHLFTPGGRQMSVSMSNCGEYGWVSDKRGYRYTKVDPLSEKPWPMLPTALCTLAHQAAQQAGFKQFTPNACLINCYKVGARMSLHQDKDEADALRSDAQPIVSFSLGLPAIFLVGGLKRSDKTQHLILQDGDALIFGGPARLMFHGIRPLAAGEDTLLGAQRINLTFRRAYD